MGSFITSFTCLECFKLETVLHMLVLSDVGVKCFRPSATMNTFK